MSPRTVGIIQARMGSTRLPGKVLMDLAGQPMLARVVERTVRAKRLDDVVVATTTSARDYRIENLCRARGWPCFRGSEDDVLDRYHTAARAHRAETIVRVTSDCPLIDPGIIDEAVRIFSEGRWDYVSNTLEPRRFPRGLEVEVLSFGVLEQAWKEDSSPVSREHVTPYVYRHPERFRLCSLPHASDHSEMRWTVDEPEDLEFVRRIYGHFGHDRFDWKDVLQLLDEHPEWAEINRHVRQRTVESDEAI